MSAAAITGVGALARVSGLGWRVGVSASVALALTGAALIAALVAAADSRAQSRELSGRLVPAAAAAGRLLGDYTAQQTALRDYVTSRHASGLAEFERAARQIPAQEARLAALVGGYRRIPGQLATAEAGHLAWLAKVAAPQLGPALLGDFGQARALQADIPLVRPYVVAVRARMAALQAQITKMQARVTARLVNRQQILLAALIAVCVIVAAIVAGGVAAVHRWLLLPFTTLRLATDAVAAGRYDTTVPAVGPAELVDLGRSAELMRTRLVAALAETERAEGKFRSLFDSAPDATLTVAANGSIVMVNARAERMFGYLAGELAGHQVEVLIPAMAGKADLDMAELGQPPRAQVASSAVGKDGRDIPVEITVSSLPASSGVAASVSIRDISDRLAAQAEQERLRAEAQRERYARRLEQSERLESLGQLVGGVAHDFNNLLNVISGYNEFTAQELAQYVAADPRLTAVLDDIGEVRAATDRAARLTRQLLTFARRDVVHPEVLDINQVIVGVEQLLRRTIGEHIGLVVAPDAGIWRVKADAGQVEQVIVNLAVNARDAMPSGGTLTINTTNVDVDQTYAASRPNLRPGRYAQLRVSDTGTGIEPEVLARVLEPFYSTKPPGKGTGLGLATVYGIVTRTGGNLHIYSESGLGTTVSVLMPATDERVEQADAPNHATPAPGRGETILLAEDEESLRELIRRILARNGYQVRVAATPADALQHAQSPEQRIDLLLTDVVMPDMLGNELAERIRGLRPALPVLYMSGYAQAVLDDQGALASDVDLLEKPFTENTILSRVRQVLDNGNGQRDTQPPVP